MNIKKILLTLIAVIAIFTTASCGETTTTTTTGSTTNGTTVTTITTEDTTISTQVTTEPTTTEEPTVTTTTTFVDQSRIEIDYSTTLSYRMYEEFNPNDITVTYYDPQGTPTVLTNTEYTLSEFDMNVIGTKQVNVTYGEYTGEFYFEVVDYYVNALGLSGSALFDALEIIVNQDFDGVSYGEARYILDETDADPSNSSNVILVYLATSVSGVWDGTTWNREHVWPQSALPDSASNGSTNTCSDLHNLKPSNPGENSYRGNKYFDDFMSGTTYEPRDEVKGDIARIMLYMVVMYDELTLVDTVPNLDNLEMGNLTTLLEWHEADPVDDFERNRNEVIFSYQFNRNPFIDHPEFVDLISW